jgi:hypothetical protein
MAITTYTSRRPALPATADALSRTLYTLNPAFDWDKARQIRSGGLRLGTPMKIRYSQFRDKRRTNSVALLAQALLAVVSEKVRTPLLAFCLLVNLE